MLFLSRLVTPDVSQFDKKTQRWIISPITFYLIFFCFEILFWNYYAFNTFSLIYTHSLFHATGGELFGNKKTKAMTFIFPVTLALKNGKRRMTSSLVLSCRRRKRKCACDKNQLSSFCSLLYFSHPSTSCTWQSSCSRTRWFSLTRMSSGIAWGSSQPLQWAGLAAPHRRRSISPARSSWLAALIG